MTLLTLLAMLSTPFALLIAILASRRVVRTLIRPYAVECDTLDDDLVQYLKAYATGSADCVFITATRLFGV